LYIAEEMVATIRKNHTRLQRQPRPREESPLDEPINQVEEVFIRLAALLHDIGHLPAGHTLEDELHLLDKHDGLGRLTTVLNREDWPGQATESLRKRIDTLYAPWVSELGLTASELVVQIVAKEPRGGEPPLPGKIPPINLFRLQVCRDIVGNTICADLLDYLHRDWYHIGKQRYFDRRLLQYMEIRRNADGVPQIVVSLGTRPKIRTDAVSAILNLLESRYELAESVLFHRTKCAAAAMLERGLQELALDHAEGAEREKWASDLEKILMDRSDKGVVDHFANAAQERRVAASTLPLDSLRQRRLYRGVLTMLRDEIPGDVAKRLLRTFAEGPDAANNRHLAMLELERDFELQPGSLAIYCPEKGMNAKIADVKIHVNGSIETFSRWERDNNSLGGGHLKAQITRFESLWRVHIFMERGEWSRLDRATLALLRTAVHTLVLGFSVTGNTLEESAEILATQLSQQSQIGYAKGKSPRPVIAARSRVEPPAYPSGAPTLRSFFG
jgi:HD superfamily phosphohydrolase